MNIFIKKMVGISLSILLFTTYTYGLVNEVTTVRNKKGNIVYLFSDVHLDKKGGLLTHQQQKILCDAARRFGAPVIAEDQYAYADGFFEMQGVPKQKRIILEQFDRNTHYTPEAVAQAPALIHLVKANTIINPKKKKRNWQQSYHFSPLDMLVKTCKHYGLVAQTVDYTMLTRASYAGLPITIADIVSLDNAFIQKLLSYKDGHTAHCYYQECIKAYHENPTTKKLRQLALSNPSLLLEQVVDELGHTPCMWHENDLMNAYLVHKIVYFGNHQRVFVYSGARHIETILPIVKKLGYTVIGHSGQPIQSSAVESERNFIIPVVDLQLLFDLPIPSMHIKKHTNKVKKQSRVRCNRNRNGCSDLPHNLMCGKNFSD